MFYELYISCYYHSLFSKIPGTFRSTKDIVGKCLFHVKTKIMYSLSYARIVPSLVFYSGKNIRAFEENTRLKDIVPDKDKSIYVVMSLNDYQKNRIGFRKGNSMPYARIMPMLC